MLFNPMFVIPLLCMRIINLSKQERRGKTSAIDTIPSFILFRRKKSYNSFKLSIFCRYSDKISQSFSVIVFEHSCTNVKRIIIGLFLSKKYDSLENKSTSIVRNISLISSSLFCVLRYSLLNTILNSSNETQLNSYFFI